MIEEGTEAAIKKHQADAYLDGFAYRMAVEVAGKDWMSYCRQHMESMYVNTSAGVLEECRRGWSENDNYLKNLKANGNLDEFIKLMKKRFPQKHVFEIKEEIFIRLKGMYDYETGELPHPYNLLY